MTQGVGQIVVSVGFTENSGNPYGSWWFSFWDLNGPLVLVEDERPSVSPPKRLENS